MGRNRVRSVQQFGRPSLPAPAPAGPVAPAPTGAAYLLDMQQRAGNRITDAFIQAKLTVGRADDPYEREADAVADAVIRRMSGRRGSRTAVPSDSGLHQAVRRAPEPGPAPDAAGGVLDSTTEAALGRARGGGKLLGPHVRSRMEEGLGTDLRGVRVHDDAGAHELNRKIGARAFTSGSDVFFRSGEYRPTTTGGQKLLAHELTHVVQQGAAPVSARQSDVTPSTAASTASVQREIDLDVDQQAQYLDLGPDLNEYAKRTKSQTAAPEGSVVEALAVLPRNEDGSLAAPAIAMIETMEKGVWDSWYDKWMDQTMPAPDRKTWGPFKEGDRKYRQRVAAAATAILEADTNEITDRPRNPELANLANPNGEPDTNVVENLEFHGVQVAVNANTSDVNAAERKTMVAQAIQKIVAAGGALGNDLEVNLPKYGRDLSLSGDCKGLDISSFGTRAVFVAPKYVHLSSEILGNPNEQMSGNERKFLSARLDPEGVGSIIHELGHYCHYRNDPSKFHSLNASTWASGEKRQLAQSVSAYAAGHPREFVAEVFLGLVNGQDFSPEVVQMYLGLGGMPVGAAARAPAAAADDRIVI